MSNSSGKLIAHTSIYFIGNLLRRIVSFIMLPIYTRCLTTADYGTIELLATILDFVGIIVGLRVAEGLFRFYGEYTTEPEKNEVFSTGLILVAMLNLLGITVVYLFSGPITSWLFTEEDASGLLILYSVTLMGTALIEIPMAYLRAQQRPWLFVFFSILHLTTQLSLNIYFVVYRSMRVEGVVYSAVFATVLTSLLILGYTFSQISLRFSMAKARQLVSFSWPLILSSAISFYIVFGDRYILKFYSGLSEVGIYSLGYKFGFLLGFLIVNPFFSFWQTERYVIVKQDNAESVFREIMLVFSLAVVSFVAIVSVVIKDVLRIMADPSFWPAARVVPLVLAAYAFDALGNYTKFGILLKKRTGLLVYGNLIATGVISVGYFTLIPRLGAIGAALATLCAYAVRFAWITAVSQKLYRLDIPWRQISLAAVSGLVICVAAQLGPDGLVGSLCFSGLLVTAFFLSLFFLPVLPAGLRSQLISGMTHPKSTLTNYLRSLTG